MRTFYRHKLSFLCAQVWMNCIRSLFTLTACSFSQHGNLSCLSSFTSKTCVFSPYTTAFICFIIYNDSACPLLLGVYLSYISSFMSHIYCFVIILCFHHLHLQFCFAVVWWERRAWKVSSALGHSTSISVDLAQYWKKDLQASWIWRVGHQTWSIL